MSTSLHDRLADLADDAPPGRPEPGLWDRGRRIHRQRTVGTAVIAAVVLLVLGVLGTASWARSRVEPAPSGPTEGMRLPDRFYAPSAHLSGTEADGPIGPVSAVVHAPRRSGWSSYVNGLAGVSASTGEYRFLDLPGWPETDDEHGSSTVALSADGRRVAYWYGERDEESETEAWRIDGVAVYDTATGEVIRRPLETPEGLAQQGLVWAGDELWFGYLKLGRGAVAGGDLEVTVWTPRDGDVRSWPDTTSFLLQATGSAGAVVSASRRDVDVWSSDRDQPVAWRSSVPTHGLVWMSPDQGRLATLGDLGGPEARPLISLTVDGPGDLTGEEVSGLDVDAVVGWRDRTHVVTVLDGTYQSVDIETGAARDLSLAVEGSQGHRGTIVAQDAWAAPTYEAPAPPNPLDQRWVVGLAAGVLLLGAVALLWWRRRVRP